MTEQTHIDAAQSLVDAQAVKSRAFLARKSRWSPDGADPDIVKFATRFCARLEDRGMPFFISELYRGRERQNELHKKGNSKARFGSSPHNFGMAVDIVHFGRYWDLSPKEWAVVGLLGKETARKMNLRVTWGGNWSFYDPAHWELADWKVRALGQPSDLPKQDDGPFAQAFAKARRAGRETFTWQGKLYSTEIA